MITTPDRKPFHKAPGRDASLDRPGPIDVARSYYDQRSAVADDAGRLRRLRELVDWPGDLTVAQWAQWYAVALEFGPDLILELGRGRGNSTALFTQAAFRLGHTRVVSLCMSPDWDDEVAPRLKAQVEPAWFDRLDARRADILIADYGRIIGDARRVLLLWDAHGFDIAEVVLGTILPLLADREHFVIMHDISDSRYTTADRSYDWTPFWKGPQWQERSGIWTARTNIGWMNSIQNQIIAIADFATRNELEIGSADHEYWRFFEEQPGVKAEMVRVLGEDGFSSEAHWAFLSLSGKAGPFVFPRSVVPPSVTHAVPVMIDRIDPAGVAEARMPIRVRTVPRPSAYAAVIHWRMPAAPPAGVAVWLRVTVLVEDAHIGVGLLNESGALFLEKHLVAPSVEPQQLFFLVGRGVDVGALAIYTWDRPASARVAVEDMSLTW